MNPIVKASEPAEAYNAPSLQGLKNRLIACIDSTTDESKPEECLALLQSKEMPCVFTEEEFEEELRLSEKSGWATEEEVAAMNAKWGC